jgi:short-subunit dehydrogenase
MRSYYKNKTAWITGASSGIGKGIALGLAKAGIKRLIISARSEDKLNELKSQLAELEVVVVPLDLADYESVMDTVETVLGETGPVDFLFNNGGISQRSKVEETGLDVYKRLMDVNYLGSVAMTKAVLPYMIGQSSGHVIAISSVAGKIGTPMRSGYSASKHALHGFFDSLRAEVSKQGIRVSLVCPGYIKTDISVNALSADGSKHGKMDENQEKGMTVEQFVQILLRKLAVGKSEIVIGGSETMGITLKRFAPGILERILEKIEPK